MNNYENLQEEYIKICNEYYDLVNKIKILEEEKKIIFNKIIKEQNIEDINLLNKKLKNK